MHSEGQPWSTCVLTLVLIAQVVRVWTDTYTQTTIFVWDYPGELVPEETFTHSHLSWSSIILYLLPPSTTIH